VHPVGSHQLCLVERGLHSESVTFEVDSELAIISSS
jgi:hypothetical protein